MRTPTASATAVLARDQSRIREEILKNSTCETPWDEASAAAYDTRCTYWLALSNLEVFVAERRVLHCLRRERNFLQLLNATCFALALPGSPCASVLADLLQTVRLQIVEAEIYTFRTDVLVWVLDYQNEKRAVAGINSRTCGDGQTGQTCVRDLLAPVLALDSKGSDVPSILEVVRAAQNGLFVASEAERQSGLNQTIEIFRAAPLEEFGFVIAKETGGATRTLSRRESLDIYRRQGLFRKLLPENWISDADVAAIKSIAQVEFLLFVFFFFFVHLFFSFALNKGLLDKLSVADKRSLVGISRAGVEESTECAWSWNRDGIPMRKCKLLVSGPANQF